MDCAGTDHLMQELEAQVSQVMTPYKYQCGITCTTELSKTICGNIRRVNLRQRECKTGGKPVE
jgi:acyl-coenzyme A synthetase/AMP-(fatty) acid ligase